MKRREKQKQAAEEKRAQEDAELAERETSGMSLAEQESALVNEEWRAAFRSVHKPEASSGLLGMMKSQGMMKWPKMGSGRVRPMLEEGGAFDSLGAVEEPGAVEHLSASAKKYELPSSSPTTLVDEDAPRDRHPDPNS